jgi:hypothetical protein
MKSTSQSDLLTASYREVGATLSVLGKYGVTVKHLARLRVDPNYAKRVAEVILQGGLVGSAHQKLARVILGENFFGVEEWSSLYGVNFSNKQLREVAEFPWSEDVLNAPCPFYKGKSVKETHFAFLGLNTFKGKPLTILKWQELHPDSGQPRSDSYVPEIWYVKEEFGNKPTCGFRWYLMPLEILPKSINRTYAEQTAMLPADYEVPLAIEEVTKVILYYRKNGIYLNPARHGRCQDVTSSNDRVVVGGWGPRGLGVGHCLDEVRDWSVGLAASRKF